MKSRRMDAINLIGSPSDAALGMGQADQIAVAHVSVLDYFGEVSCKAWPALKTWHMR